MLRFGPIAAGVALAFSTTLGAYAQQVSDSVVKIGILNDQYGVYADFGGKWSVEAARIAVEDFGGKVLNAPIEIINADHQNKPDVASGIARQWYDTDRVDPLTTGNGSVTFQADVRHATSARLANSKGSGGWRGKNTTSVMPPARTVPAT